jgi:L-asparagine transporter-like permease
MLFSLGKGGYAPEWMGKVSRNGVPHRALLASTAGIIAAIMLAIFAPKNAFLMLYGTAVAGMLFVWLVILSTHLRFRQAMTRERLSTLPMRFAGAPIVYLARHSFPACDFGDNLLRGRVAMVVSGIFCFLSYDFAVVPARPPARHSLKDILRKESTR